MNDGTFEYDTTLLDTAQGDVKGLRSAFESIMGQLNSDVASTVEGQNEGSIVQNFQSEVFAKAANDLEVQRGQIQTLENLIGIISDELNGTTSAINSNMSI